MLTVCPRHGELNLGKASRIWVIEIRLVSNVHMRCTAHRHVDVVVRLQEHWLLPTSTVMNWLRIQVQASLPILSTKSPKLISSEASMDFTSSHASACSAHHWRGGRMSDGR